MLENAVLVPNYSMRNAVEHYIVTRQAEIDASIQAERLVEQQEPLLEELTNPAAETTETMSSTAEKDTKKIHISWYPTIICLGFLLLFVVLMVFPIHRSFNKPPTATSPTGKLHLSTDIRMRNGWISTQQYEQEKAKKEYELLTAQTRQAKLENERQIMIDRLNRNRKYWEQREKEEQNDQPRKKKREETLRVQQTTTKDQLVACLNYDFYRWVVTALRMMRVHLDIFVDGLYTTKFPHRPFGYS